jgi:hypothetical protein
MTRQRTVTAYTIIPIKKVTAAYGEIDVIAQYGYDACAERARYDGVVLDGVPVEVRRAPLWIGSHIDGAEATCNALGIDWECAVKPRLAVVGASPTGGTP